MKIRRGTLAFTVLLAMGLGIVVGCQKVAVKETDKWYVGPEVADVMRCERVQAIGHKVYFQLDKLERDMARVYASAHELRALRAHLNLKNSTDRMLHKGFENLRHEWCAVRQNWVNVKSKFGVKANECEIHGIGMAEKKVKFDYERVRTSRPTVIACASHDWAFRNMDHPNWGGRVIVDFDKSVARVWVCGRCDLAYKRRFGRKD